MFIHIEDEQGIMAVIEITDSIRFWLKLINIVDLLINCLALFIFVICMRIFFKRPMCHFHLVMLMSSSYAAGTVIVLGGIFKCLLCLTDFTLLAHPSTYPKDLLLKWVEGIRAWALLCGMLSMSAVIVERIWATIKLQSYEHTSNVHAASLMVALCWIFGSGFFVLCFVMQYFLTTVAIWFVITIFTGVGYRCAFKVNVKRLKASKSQSANVYVLSQRYQLTENIRIFSMLQRCNYGFIMCCTIGLCFVTIMLMFTNVGIFKTREYVIREGLHLMICVACNILSLSSITGTYVWRQMLLSYFKHLLICHFPRKKRIHQCEEVEEGAGSKYKMSIEVRNSDGVPLAFNAQEEADIYFKQLNKLWT